MRRVCAALLALSLCIGSDCGHAADEPIMSVTAHDNLISVQARQMPVDHVLLSIAHASDLDLHIADGAGADLGTWSFKDQPLPTALRQILGCHGWVLVEGSGERTGAGSRGKLYVLACAPVNLAANSTLLCAQCGARAEGTLEGAVAGDTPHAVSLALAEALRQGGPEAARDNIAAIEALGPDVALPAFEHGLGASDPAVRDEVVAALARLGSDDAVRALGQAALGDRDPLVRQAALGAIANAASSFVRPLLREALNDPDKTTRELAASLLGEATSSSHAGPLKKVGLPIAKR